jgi:hypothetical protein
MIEQPPFETDREYEDWFERKRQQQIINDFWGFEDG